MKRFMLVISLILILGSTAVFAEEKTGTPQEAAGNVYKQLLDTDKVTVSEITFKPGDKAAMHTHNYPHVVYIIEGGELTLTKPDGTSSKLEAKPSDVIWMEAETHEAVNTGTTTLRATVTEIK